MDPNDHIVTNLDRRPCGCVLTEYADGRKIYAPCVACGIMRAGWLLTKAATGWPWARRRHLMDAGNALAAVSTAIRKSGENASTINLVNDALEQANDE